MIHTPDETVSLWQNIPSPIFPSLETHHNTEVCIIGSGIVGLSTAYELMKSGVSVTVIDDGEIGGRQTVRTTAHLSNAYDDRYYKVAEMHGPAAARAVAESHTAAILKIRTISRIEKIECDFQELTGYLFLDPTEGRDLLEKERTACLQAGVAGVELIESVSGSGFDLGPALRFPGQAQMHPGKYVEGLAACLKNNGVEFFTHTRAVQVTHDPDLCVVTLNGSKIFADSVVVATHVPINTLVRMHTKLTAYRSYVSAYTVPKNSFPNALFWDTADPYHYVRVKAGIENDTLIVGGEDHRTGQEPDRDPYAMLETWTRMRFPQVGARVGHWSGQIIEPVDRLAYIGSMGGRNKDIYVATGDSGNGMTYGPIAGMLIRDLITQRENAWTKVYDPNRLRLRATARFISENANTFAQYADWISPAEAATLNSVVPGEGAILSSGLRKVAAYRDHRGYMHLKSAVCPHLEGLVRWNDQEKTWDCPCHGSRFSGTGEVINGPAVQNLADTEVVAAEELRQIAEPIRSLPPPMQSSLSAHERLRPERNEFSPIPSWNGADQPS